MQQNGGMTNQMETYFKSKTGIESFRKMGQDSGISYSTIRRQLTGEGELTAAVVVALARTYGINVLEALVAADFITEEEAGSSPSVLALETASDTELAQEILRRVSKGSATEALTEPLDAENVGGTDDTDVPATQSDHALAAKKRSKNRGETIDD